MKACALREGLAEEDGQSATLTLILVDSRPRETVFRATENERAGLDGPGPEPEPEASLDWVGAMVTEGEGEVGGGREDSSNRVWRSHVKGGMMITMSIRLD